MQVFMDQFLEQRTDLSLPMMRGTPFGLVVFSG